VPEAVVRTARATAAAVNRLLNSDELPLPSTIPPYALPTVPTTDTRRASSLRGAGDLSLPSQCVDRLLCEGALTVSLDCEQLIDLLFEIADAPS
jgi:hypothetical protein